jgi:pimeloyl-ACP methyl ester carboxylesterase
LDTRRPAVEADYDVIMVDARGHGRSDAPAAGYNPTVMADELAGVITALGRCQATWQSEKPWQRTRGGLSPSVRW